jgi:argininosuccinate lyase
MLWGGRFSGGLDSLAAEFNASIGFDWRLWDADIRGSVAWARALARASVITVDESALLAHGLQAVWAEFAAGQFRFSPTDEDIHTAVERRLGEIVGAAAGKLHTGRSRNDQVATDMRLWVMQAAPECARHILGVQRALARQAETHLATLLPGYTHVQRAQPIVFGHWLLAHFWALERDAARFEAVALAASVMPLGSGALAGTAFAVDRILLARDLGFRAVAANSLDAVGDRDFVAEFLFAAALLGSHLSRLAEALILYASAEFGYVEFSDAFSTGSSLMPQKKNPDMLELARGKAGTLAGSLTGLLASLKGLPSAYDKDLQEDKPALFAAYDTLRLMLPVLAGTLATMRVNPGRMRAGLDTAMLATDLADHLVRGGLPFREAHGVAGRAVRRALEQSVSLEALGAEEWSALHPGLESTAREVFDPAASVARRSAVGGTAPSAVAAQLAEAKNRLKSRQFA